MQYYLYAEKGMVRPFNSQYNPIPAKGYKRFYRLGTRSMIISALVILALGFFDLSSLIMLIASILIVLTPVFIGFLAWIRIFKDRQVLILWCKIIDNDA